MANSEVLRTLLENATLFARAYIRLVEELMRAGVPEEDARKAASLAVASASLEDAAKQQEARDEEDEEPWKPS